LEDSGCEIRSNYIDFGGIQSRCEQSNEVRGDSRGARREQMGCQRAMKIVETSWGWMIEEKLKAARRGMWQKEYMRDLLSGGLKEVK